MRSGRDTFYIIFVHIYELESSALCVTLHGFGKVICKTALRSTVSHGIAHTVGLMCQPVCLYAFNNAHVLSKLLVRYSCSYLIRHC